MKKEDIDKYIEKYVTELKLLDYSERTISSYLFFLRPFLETIDNPEKVNIDKVKLYSASLIDKYSNKSRALAISSLRFFFKNIVERPDIFVKLKVPKKEEYLPSILTLEEIKLLVNTAKTTKSKLIIKLLYSAGLRVSEVVNLKVKDLDFNESSGWVRQGKGKKDRLFKIAENLSKEIKIFTEEKCDEEYVFSTDKPLSTRNIQDLIRRISKKAGISKKVTPHTLRHSFATHLLEDGENLVMIQQLLGHKNIETTKIYTHISQEQIKKVKSPGDKLY